jgi:ribosome-associated translation inhibitor RaiA
VEIIFHAHNAVISERLRERSEHAIQKLASRMSRVVDAIVRFEQDGPTRRVEVVLHAPRRSPLVAEGQARYYGPALSQALARIEAQLIRRKRTPKTRARTLARV